eukprot:4310013-Prymnesium_polylepis.1
MGHFSLDFHGFWLDASGEGIATWTHVLSHRGPPRHTAHGGAERGGSLRRRGGTGSRAAGWLKFHGTL